MPLIFLICFLFELVPLFFLIIEFCDLVYYKYRSGVSAQRLQLANNSRGCEDQ